MSIPIHPSIRLMLLCWWLVTPAMAETVAGWRGDGSGVFADQDPPLQWDDQRNIRWRTPLPNWSNSSPVVADGRVFVISETREAGFPELLCLDAGTGSERWRVLLDHVEDRTLAAQWSELNAMMRTLLELRGEYLWLHETQPDDQAARLAAVATRLAGLDGAWLQETPDVKDGKKYFAVRSSQLPLDGHLGRRFQDQGLWFPDWGLKCSPGRHGAAPSVRSSSYHSYDTGGSGSTWCGHALPTPLVVDDTVYVSTGFNALFAIAVGSGALRWVQRYPVGELRKMGMDFSYSPRWIDGKVVSLAGKVLRAVDPTSGATLWQVPVPDWSIHQRNDLGITTIDGCPVIVVANGTVYRADDGKVLVEGLGAISKNEGLFLVHDDLVVNTFRVSRLLPDGDGLRAETLHRWGAEGKRKGGFRNRGGSNKSAEYVCRDGLMHAVQVFDLRSGAKVTDFRKAAFGGAPSVLAGDRVHYHHWRDHGRRGKISTYGGTTQVVAASGQPKLLAENRLSLAPVDKAKLRKLWRNGEVREWRHFGAAAPYAANDCLYIRSYDELICVGR